MKNLYKALLVTIWSVGLWLGAGALVSAQTPVLLKTGTTSNFVYGPSEMYFSVDGFLWKTDGSPAGTVQIKDNVGQPVDYSYAPGLIVSNRFYFLTKDNPSSSYKTFLMYVDNNGVVQRAVLPAVLATSSIDRLIAVRNQLYFTIPSFSSYSSSLWQIKDNTSPATLFGTFNGSLPTAVYRNKLYFIADSKLWQADSSVSPISINNLDYPQLTADNNYLYINAQSTATYKPVLYQSDGTDTGTKAISFSTSVPALTVSYITGFLPIIKNDQLYIRAYTVFRGYSNDIYKVNPVSNQLELATEIYGQLPAGIAPFTNRIDNFTLYNGLYYFAAGPNGVNNVELWRSDGTLVKDIQAGVGTSDPQGLYVYNGKLYFSASASFIGRILYRSDGTEAGTQPVTDITGSAISGGGLFFSFKSDTYFSGTGGLYKLTTTPTSPPTTTGLTLTTPTYDCTTGLLSLSTTGGNGQPIDYRIAGIRDYGSSATFTVPAYQRTNTSFTLEARQSGVVVSLPFVSACQSVTTTPPTSPTQPTGTGLTLTTPAYDCNSGQLTLATNGGNGTPIDFRIAGLRDYGPSPTFTVPAYQRLGTSFTLEARQSGQVVTLPFTSACQSTTTTPTQPTGGTLSVSAQALNCQTGALQLTTTGGDGTPIDFKVPGLRDYSSSPTFTVPAYQRTNTTFTLYARQSGREVTATYAAACPVSGRLASAEPNTDLRVVVYPNPVGEQFSVGVSGASGQAVRFHLTNLSGQTMIEQRTQVSSDAHTETMKLPASGAGLYLLQVSTPNQSRTVKVLKP